MKKPEIETNHKKCIKLYMAILFFSAIIFSAGCNGGGGGGGGDDTSGGPGTVNLSMKVSNLSPDGILSEANISPKIYKIALVNFWLIKDDNTEVNLINRDEDDPLIVDFSSGDVTEQLLTDAPLSEGTYTGYKMQFIYIEMQFPVYFHLPSICVESDLATVFGWDISSFQPTEIVETIPCNFRLYFNAHDKYWKRDFVLNLNIEDEEGNIMDEWFWLRREVNEEINYDNFFISVTENTHPSGGSGPDNTIDLFDDPAFWGSPDDYANSTSPIIITSNSTVGGLNATIEPFTISGGEYNLTVNVDVGNTLNYTDNSTEPAGVSFHPDMLDLGPSYQSTVYGDQGLHPFLPAFSVVSETVTS